MIDQLPNDIDAITTFLHNAGWTYNWTKIEEVWMVGIAKGETKFVVEHRTLKRALMLVRNLVLGIN